MWLILTRLWTMRHNLSAVPSSCRPWAAESEPQETQPQSCPWIATEQLKMQGREGQVVFQPRPNKTRGPAWWPTIVTLMWTACNKPSNKSRRRNWRSIRGKRKRFWRLLLTPSEIQVTQKFLNQKCFRGMGHLREEQHTTKIVITIWWIQQRANLWTTPRILRRDRDPKFRRVKLDQWRVSAPITKNRLFRQKVPHILATLQKWQRREIFLKTRQSRMKNRQLKNITSKLPAVDLFLNMLPAVSLLPILWPRTYQRPIRRRLFCTIRAV